jgi:hypothetical protein
MIGRNGLKGTIYGTSWLQFRAGLEHMSNTTDERALDRLERDKSSRKRSCTPTNGANIIMFDAGSTGQKTITIETHDVSPRKVVATYDK